MNLILCLRIVVQCVVYILWIVSRVDANRQYWDSLKENDIFTPDKQENSITYHSKGRPSPSDALPVQELIENPDTSLDPKEGDMDYKKLRRMLGKNYDRSFMSVVRPLESILRPNGTLEFKIKKGRPKERRPNYIKYFGTPVFFGSGKGTKLRVSRRTRKKIQKYLWSYTHCPVFYTWKDLGIRFWPRWIKEGQCYQKRSCSVPPGMKCKPSDSTTKIILRWHCQEWQKDCTWIQMYYPMITQCSCSC